MRNSLSSLGEALKRTNLIKFGRDATLPASSCTNDAAL
jgi:hypothetical protein